MAVDVVNDAKNLVSVTNDSKSGNAATFDEYDDTWAETEGTWAVPNTPMQAGASKNLVTVVNDSKN